MAKSCLQKRIIKNRLEGLANKRYSLESSFLLKNTYKMSLPLSHQSCQNTLIV